jgi:predicted HicB family RNase H-like nuclease
MTVKKKASKIKETPQYDISEIINRGGKTSGDSSSSDNNEMEIRFTLRIPKKMIHKIDKDKEKRVGNVSRNQWIIEAIADKLN